MPRLVLLNGPPGIGKSTLARRYLDDHALALDLDIDVLRAALGHWQTDERSKALARSLAVVLARAHLASGHDVVVPQLVANPAFVAELEALAKEAGATFHEILLTDAPENVVARFLIRRTVLAGAAHPEAEVTSEQVLEVHEQLLRRSGPIVVPTTAGAVGAAYAAVLDALVP